MAPEKACLTDAPLFAPERDMSSSDGRLYWPGWEDGSRTVSSSRPVACSTRAVGCAETEMTARPCD